MKSVQIIKLCFLTLTEAGKLKTELTNSLIERIYNYTVGCLTPGLAITYSDLLHSHDLHVLSLNTMSVFNLSIVVLPFICFFALPFSLSYCFYLFLCSAVFLKLLFNCLSLNRQCMTSYVIVFAHHNGSHFNL